MMQKSPSHKTSRPARDAGSALPVVSAREALLTPTKDVEDLELAKAMIAKLQQIGRANGPNDPSLS